MTAEALYFIQPHIVERLISGQFVAKRQQTKAYKLRDRRNMLSPLNITRRAIRYEPLVFSNRKADMIDAVQILNQPEKKLLMVSGPTGRGKTSFVRGIIEMMGGGAEQLLWFDVSRHSDFDEVIRFLVESITELCHAQTPSPLPAQQQENPIATLETLLNRVADFPILLVIDNMEYLVAPDQTIRAKELKDAFNFLLSFANIKLILAGKQLPLADMNPSAKASHQIILPPLTETQSQTLVADICPQFPQSAPDFAAVIQSFGGEPYLLSLFATLFDRHTDTSYWLDAFNQFPENPKQVLLNHLTRQLSNLEKQVLSILALIRHSITPLGLQTLASFCEPALENMDLSTLDRMLIRCLLRKVYPPQLILNYLRHQQKDTETASHRIEAYYQLSEQFQSLVIQTLPEEQQSEYHQRLQQFYLAEKNKHILERVYQTRSRHLNAEAQYHYTQGKKHKRALSLSEPFMSQTAELEENMPAQYRYIPQPLMPNAETPLEEIVSSTDLPWSILHEDTLAFTTALETDISSREPHPVETTAQTSGSRLDLRPTSTVRLSDSDLAKLATLIARSSTSASWAEESSSLPINQPDLGALKNEQTDEADRIGLEFAFTEHDATEAEIIQVLKEAVENHQKGIIAQQLYALGKYRLTKGFWNNGEDCLLKALEFSQEEESDPLTIKIQAELGHYYQIHFQHNKALQALRDVEHYFDTAPPQTLDELERFVQALLDKAEILIYRKQFDQGLQIYEKSLALKPNNARFKAEILFKMGLALDEAGRVDEAAQQYQACFEISDMFNDPRSCSAALYNLGSLHFEQGRYSEAKSTLEQCLTYDHKVNVPAELHRSLMFLSKIDEAQHQLKTAYQFAQEAYRLALQDSHTANIASACLRLGHLSEAMKQWTQAVSYYRKAQTIAANGLSEESRQWIDQKLKSVEEHL